MIHRWFLEAQKIENTTYSLFSLLGILVYISVPAKRELIPCQPVWNWAKPYAIGNNTLGSRGHDDWGCCMKRQLKA